MATYTTSSAVGEREDLSDIITNISPTETPVYNKGSKTMATNTLHEWQTQVLGAANADNAQAEGADATFADPTPTERLGNNTQIFRRDAAVSGTLRKSKTAGREDEADYQQMLKALEIRRDVEASITSSNTKSSGSPRKSAGLAAFIRNVESAATQTSFSGDGSNVPTSGAARAITVDLINSAMQASAEDGGKPDCMIVSPARRTKVSKLQGSANTALTRSMTPQGQMSTVVTGVSMFETDFGAVEVVTDTFAPDDRVYLLQSQYVGWASYEGRNFVVEPLAKTGDAEKFQVIQEGCLVVEAPTAHAAIYDLN